MGPSRVRQDAMHGVPLGARPLKIAIIGAAGQLGTELCRLISQDRVDLTHDDVRIEDPASVSGVLQRVAPDVVINTAAHNRVDDAEDDPGLALAVNARGPLNLARTCSKLGCLLVHFSTDYVFGLDGTRTAPYDEDDPPGPVSVYGASKLAGEYYVRALCPRHAVIRTCGLYGLKGARRKGGNFVETMLRLGAEPGRKLRIVADQTCTPSSAADVAAKTVELLQVDPHGVYHIGNSGSCTWFEFAAEIFRLAGLSPGAEPVTSEEYGVRARRPAYSVLGHRRLVEAGLAPMRPWQDALAAYLDSRA